MNFQYYTFHKNYIKERLRPPHDMPMQTRRGDGSIVLRHRNTTSGGGGWSSPCPGRCTRRKDPTPIVHKTGWASEPVWAAWKISTPLDFDPRTVQPVTTSLYQLRHPSRQYLHRTLVKCVVQCASDKQTTSERRTESREGKDLGGICEDFTPWRPFVTGIYFPVDMA